MPVYRPFPQRTLMALAAACFAPVVLADDPSREAPAQLAPVIVQSSPLGQTADDLVHPVEVVDGEDLDRRRRGTIGDVLEHRPGISSASFGPGVGRPVIRGQGGPRVQILDNGIGSMDASSISADHAVAVDPLNADRVEVIKGPATLIYGPAASAGVVNVVDDRLPEIVVPGVRLKGDLSYGDNGDERNGALRWRYGTGTLQLGAQAARRDAGTFEIPGYATRAGAEAAHDHGHEDHGHDHGAPERYGVLDNSHLDSLSYGASAAWVGGAGMLGAAVSRFETNYGIAGHSHDHDEDHDAGEDAAGHSHEGVRIDLEQTRIDLRGLRYDPLSGFERLEARVGINDYRHREIAPDGQVGTTFDVQELEGRLELAHRPVRQWAGVIGLHAHQRDFRAVGAEAFVPPVDTQGLGLFWVEGRPLGVHRVEIGARVDRVEHRLQQAGAPDRAFTPVSVSAGTHLRLDDHLHLRLNAQRAQRAPAPEELYAFGPHLATLAFERGHVDLDVETANTLDIHLSRDEGRWTWEIGVFYNRIDDYIFLREVDAGLDADGSGTPRSDGVADRVDESGRIQSAGELLLLDFTQGDAAFYGAELSTRWRVIDQGPLRLELSGFADTVRGTLKTHGGENLPRMTPSRLGVAMAARYGALSGQLGYTRVFEQDRLAPLETNTPGHDLVHADIGYRLPAGPDTAVTLYLQGRNLLDEKQRLATSFLKDVSPQPGRSLFVGVRFDFQPPV